LTANDFADIPDPPEMSMTMAANLQEFQELQESYGIKPVATTVKSPRSNGVIERVHLTMGNMLRTMTF